MCRLRILLSTILGCTLLALPTSAAVPGQIDFQGLLLDASEQPVNGAVDLAFALFTTPSGGTSVWDETHTGVQVVDGVYDVTLGATTPLTPELVGGGALYLEITVGGETLSPRERLVAVPYALRAAHAEAADAAASVGGVGEGFVSQLWEHVAFDGTEPPNDDPSEGLADTDGDGLANFIDPDNDDDQIPDADELTQGADINLPTPIVDAFAPPTADGWTTSTVQVQGRNFQPGLAVAFGSETPVASNVTPTSFEVDVGPQPEGTVAVQVTNPNGEVGSSSYPFFFYVPTITNLSPASGPFDAPSLVTVTGTNSIPGLTVSFGTENPTPSNLTPTSFEVTIGPQPPAFVPVQVTLPNGKVSNTKEFIFSAGRKVFVTSTVSQGDLGGIAGADAKCNAAAAAAGRTGTFFAWISGEGVTPATRFSSNALGWGLYDGSVVATDLADLTDGSISAAIDVDEYGNTITTNTLVWTATAADGTQFVTGDDCDDWTSTTASARRGDAKATNDDWTNAVTYGCSSLARLYCFEQ